MRDQRSVLIVDRLAETREVLQTALERLGLRTFVTSQVQRGVELAQRHHPDLIVLDLEIDDSPGARHSARLAEQSRADRSQLVMLGSLRRNGPPPDGEFVPKPYHYGSLIRRIEELLVEP